MSVLVDIIVFFQQNPALAVFLTVSVGFWIGKFRWKNFSLGTVTSVLLIGILIGQMKIDIPEPAKTLFFLMFLFAIGYGVGPQFFRSLRKGGLPQAGFAAIICLFSLGTVWLCSVIMGYNAAAAAGLMAGSQTMSAVLGVAADTIKQMPALKDTDLGIMTASYAITYIFGTAGSAWIIGIFGPRLLGGIDKVKAAARELESQMGNDMSITPGFNAAAEEIEFRAFKAENEFFKNSPTVKEFEEYAKSAGRRLFIERVRQKGMIKYPDPEMKIYPGDEIVISGRRLCIIEEEPEIGPEIFDKDLVNFSVEKLPVIINKKRGAGKTIKHILNREYMHGVSISSIRRTNVSIPVLGSGKLDVGDRLELVGLKQDVERAAVHLGFIDPITEKTSMTMVGLGIVSGGFIFGRILVVHLGTIPLSLTLSGGVLIAGLVCGWLRSRRPDLGGIPDSSVWFMNNVGLNVFIAIVGISTGPTFTDGLQAMGWSVLLVGIIATTLPLIGGIFAGKYIFKFNDALNLGCVSGTRTTTASLIAVQEAIESNIPAMGFTIPYAVGNTLFIIWGVVIVLLIA